MGINDRQGFLQLAGIVEGGTVVLAVGLGWIAGVDPWEHVRWSGRAVLLGLAGALPIFAVYFAAPRTRSVAVELMGRPLSRCRWYDLVLLAALAGLGEELLFRGVLQPWMSGWAPWFGFLAANLLFGLVHCITPVYAVLATGIGMYFSWLAYHVSGANLATAMIAHGGYDFVAFLLIIREYRSTKAALADSVEPGRDEDAQVAE